MGMLAKLIKTAVSTVLLNKAMRSAFIVALIKTMKWMLRPSTISKITAFFAKRSGFLGPAALSALAALLLGTLRGRVENSSTNGKRQKNQIIDLDDYTILDDRH